jgi:hypothetical protein
VAGEKSRNHILWISELNQEGEIGKLTQRVDSSFLDS